MSCHVLYLIHGNQNSQHLKIYKNQKLERQKRLKRQRNQLDKYKILKKNKKRVQKKELIDTQGEGNTNTAAEELVSSESIASYNPMQNTWNKPGKSSKTGQDKKSMISTFACFLTATAEA